MSTEKSWVNLALIFKRCNIFIRLFKEAFVILINELLIQNKSLLWF